MHNDECDWSGGLRCSEENVEESCRDSRGTEAMAYKGGNDEGPLCLEEYYWGSNPCWHGCLTYHMCVLGH